MTPGSTTARRPGLPAARPASFGLGLGLGLGLACFAGCSSGGGSSGGGTTDSFDRNALLENIGTTMVLPAYEAFASSTAALLAATEAYEDAVKGVSGTPSTTLATVRQRWEEAIDLWAEAELYQFGPAGLASQVVGGQGLRDRIYSWSIVNLCRVDTELGGDAPYTDSNLIVAFGLDALEYLIARADGTVSTTESVCDPANAGFTTLAQDAQELAERRAEYMVEAAGRLDGDAVALRDAWRASGGDFIGRFSNAGTSGTGYANAQVAVNDVFAAMFYLDTVVKDEKLAAPAGIGGPADADLVESPFLNRSKRHLVANLRAFQRLFLGNRPGEAEAIGFDDFLAERGASALAIQMTNEIAQAVLAVENIDVNGEANGTLRNAIVTADGTAQAAHQAVKEVTDLLKTQFVTVLNLNVPQQGAGDND